MYVFSVLLVYFNLPSLRPALITKSKSSVNSDDERDPPPTTRIIKKVIAQKLSPKLSPLPVDVEDNAASNALS